MFSGGLWGNAATSMDKAAQEWRRIFLAEEQTEKEEALQRDRMALDEQRLQWEQQRALAAEEGADRRLNLQRQWTIWDAQWEKFNAATDPVVRQGFLNLMQESGSDYYSQALDDIKQSFFSSPQTAATYISEIYNPQNLTFRPDVALAEEAARQVGRGLNWDQERIDQYVADTIKSAQERNAEGADMHALAISDRATASQQASANLDQTYAQTAESQARSTLLVAQRNELIASGAREEELHAGNMALLNENVEAAKQANDFSLLYNPLLIRELSLKNDGTATSNETARATQAYVISQARDNASIAGSNAEVAAAQASTAWTMAYLDVENAGLDLELKRASIQQTLQQITESEARIKSMGIQDETALAALEESRIAVMLKLVESGQTGLLEAYGFDYLKDIVGEYAVHNVLSQLRETSTSNREAADKAVAASIAIDTAAAKYAEDQALAELNATQASAQANTAQAGILEKDLENYDADREWQREVQERGLRVQEGQLALQRDELAFKSSQAAQEAARATSPEGVAAATNKMLNDARIALGFGVDEIISSVTDYTSARQGYANDFDVMSPKAQQESKLDLLARESSIVNRISATLEYGIARGVVFTPQQLGLPANSPYYFQALARNPAFAEAWTPPAGDTTEYTEEEIDTNTQIMSDVEALAFRMTDEQAAGFGAEAAYDTLGQTYAPEELAKAGITSPQTLAPHLRESQAEFTQNYRDAVRLTSPLGVGELVTPESREQALSALNELVARAERLKMAQGEAVKNDSTYQAWLAEVQNLAITAQRFGAIDWRNNAGPTYQLNGMISAWNGAIGNIQWLNHRSDSEFAAIFSAPAPADLTPSAPPTSGTMEDTINNPRTGGSF